MEVNFKANFINKTYVQKLNPVTSQFCSQEVSFVEINPRLKDDIKALKKLVNNWGSRSLFTDLIYKIAKSDPRRKTYFLTEQSSDFEKIDFTKILGISQLSKEDVNQYCIECLETRPDIQKSNKARNCLGVGTEILESLKKLFFDKRLRVNYIFEELDFYLKNGFENEPFGDLVWKAQNRK